MGVSSILGSRPILDIPILKFMCNEKDMNIVSSPKMDGFAILELCYLLLIPQTVSLEMMFSVVTNSTVLY